MKPSWLLAPHSFASVDIICKLLFSISESQVNNRRALLSQAGVIIRNNLIVAQLARICPSQRFSDCKSQCPVSEVADNKQSVFNLPSVKSHYFSSRINICLQMILDRILCVVCCCSSWLIKPFPMIKDLKII